MICQILTGPSVCQFLFPSQTIAFCRFYVLFYKNMERVSLLKGMPKKSKCCKQTFGQKFVLNNTTNCKFVSYVNLKTIILFYVFCEINTAGWL